jgi:protein O-mannosyl-transferase
MSTAKRSTTTTRLRPWAAPIAGAVAFGSSLGFGFVYDDWWTIVQNSALAGPLRPLLAASMSGRARALGIPDATRPTMIASMWLDRHLFGLRPMGFHATSLVLYLAVCALAYCVARTLLARPAAALVAAIFFAVAPLHAEVVCAINYREDLLVALFALASFAVVFAPRRFTSPRPSMATSISLAVAMLLAFGAKESAAAVPLMLLAVAWARKERAVFYRRNELVFWALGAALLLALNWRLGLGAADDVPRAPFEGWLPALFSTARYEVEIAWGALFPFASAPEHVRGESASWSWCVALAALIALAIWCRRRPTMRPFAIAIAFALVAPLASSPLVHPANQLADRYYFLSTFGGALVWGRLYEHVARSGTRWRLAVRTGLALVLAIRASFVFRDDLTLWTRATQVAADSPRAWTGLAHALRLRGDLQGAERAVDRALLLDPLYAPGQLTYAYVLLAAGRVAEASEQVRSLNRRRASVPGLARIRRCLELPPARASTCIGR